MSMRGSQDVRDLFQVSRALVLQLIVLQNAVAGILVTLNDHRPVDRKSHIPTDVALLREAFRRRTAQVKGFPDPGDHHVLERCTRHRMGLIDVSVVVDDVAVDSAVLTHAEIQIVGTADDVGRVLIDAEGVAQHHHLTAALAQGDDAEGVDNAGIEPVDRFTLDDGLLQQQIPVGDQPVIEGFFIRRRFQFDPLDAVAALPDGHFGKKHLFSLQKGKKFREIRLPQIEIVPAEEVLKIAVEDQLIIQNDLIVIVIEVVDDLIEFLRRDEGIPFGTAQVNIVAAKIVRVAGAALEHGADHGQIDIGL